MKTLLLICLLGTFSSRCFASERGPGSESAFSGTVIDASSKKPVADVVVVAKSQSSEQKFTTNNHGEFTIPSLPDGTYTFRFEKNNYKPVEKKNVVVKRNAAKINVELLMDETEENYRNWLMKIDFL